MMKLNFCKGLIFLCVIITGGISCGDADLFNTDKWSDKIIGDWTPGVKAKVAKGEFSLWDLLQNTSGKTDSLPIQKVPVEGGNDSMLVIQYTKEDIFSINLDDVFRLNEETLELGQNLEIPQEIKDALAENPGGVDIGREEFDNIRNLSEDSEVDILLPDEFIGSQLSEIVLNGMISYNLPQLGEVKYRVQVLNGESELIHEVVEGTNPVKDTKNFNEVFQLVDNKIKLLIKVELIEGVYTGGDLTVDIRLSDYNFERVKGNFKRAGGIMITGDPFDMGNEFLEDIGGNFQFSDPKIVVDLKNKGIGVPVRVDVSFETKGKDENLYKLQLNNPLDFGGNNTEELRVVSQEVSKDNSNVVEFLSLPPQGDISYAGEVQLNPLGNADSVIFADGSLGMDVHVVIPLAFTGEITYQNTLDDIDIDSEYADKIEKGTLRLVVEENGLPMNLAISALILQDGEGQEIDRLKAEGDGVIEAKGNGTLLFNIDKAKAANLGKTKKMVLDIGLSNEDVNITPVLSSAKVKFYLTLDVQANITDLNL